MHIILNYLATILAITSFISGFWLGSIRMLTKCNKEKQKYKEEIRNLLIARNIGSRHRD